MAAEHSTTLKERLTATDNWGMTAFHLAATSDMADVLQYMVEKGGQKINVTTMKNVTAVHMACENGRKRAASFLLKQKNLLRRKSAVSAAHDDIKEYLKERAAEGAYGRKKEKKVYNRNLKESETQVTVKEQKRQGDWEKFTDPYSANKVYFFNHSTQESAWDEPPGWLHVRGDKPMMRFDNSVWLHNMAPPKQKDD
jgi:ankyrin repeat protein